MPRFAVPITITLSAKDAQHAQNTGEGSSLTSLEIPGLIRVSIENPKPLIRKARRPIPSRSRNSYSNKK